MFQLPEYTEREQGAGSPPGSAAADWRSWKTARARPRCRTENQDEHAAFSSLFFFVFIFPKTRIELPASLVSFGALPARGGTHSRALVHRSSRAAATWTNTREAGPRHVSTGMDEAPPTQAEPPVQVDHRRMNSTGLRRGLDSERRLPPPRRRRRESLKSATKAATWTFISEF